MGEPRIPAEKLSALVTIDPVRSIAPFVSTWALVAATCFVQARFGSLWTLPIAMLFIARSQHALAILMHEGAHARILPSRAWNDFVGGYFAGYAVLISLTAYRRAHTVHHKDPLAPSDPDLVLTSGYPVTLRKLAGRLLRDLAGISFFKVLTYVLTGMTLKERRQVRSEGMRPVNPYAMKFPVREVTKSLLTQSVLFAIFYAAGAPELYVLLWILPLITVLQVLLRLRGLADHANLPEPTEERPLPQHMRTRTVLSNPITKFFLAPLDVGYHLEHHLYVGLPWYRLREAHAILKPAFEAAGAPIERGYFRTLKSMIQR